MSPAGSKILPFPLFRRSEQTGITQRSFPARWLALLLMGSVGAAYALNPTPQEKEGLSLATLPTAKMVIEGEPQVVSQLMGSLVGEVAMSKEDRDLIRKGALTRRIVLESVVSPASDVEAMREKAEFLRTVEDLEAEYLTSNRYPALPATSGQGAALSYRAESDDFTLSSGNRRYTAAAGMTYGTPPASGVAFGLKGFLSPKTSGWGPWQSEDVSLDAKPGAEGLEALAFLTDLPQAGKGTARIFFPIDRPTCGYLFRHADGKTAYKSGELTYDGVSGNFSLKLFRSAQAETQALSPKALEAELANHDTATTVVGESALMADLGLLAASKKGEEVVAISTSSVLPLSASSALDGLRLASMERHKEVLSTGKFLAGEDSSGKATLVGSVQVLDKMGQLNQLRVRGGRGANYDWIVGQVCPLADGKRPTGFVDSQAASYEQAAASRQQPVKAGQ